MGPTVFSDPFINWVAGAMLLGIIAALALAHDARKRSRAGKHRHAVPTTPKLHKQA